MGQQQLAIYLNDHLGASVGALALMEHIEESHASSPIAVAVERVRVEIQAEQQVLESLVARLGTGESPARKAIGWAGEHLIRLKLRVDDPSDGALRLFQALEVISLGIAGKNALWYALAASAPRVPALRGTNYAQLIARGDEQRATIEALRIDAARDAFARTES